MGTTLDALINLDGVTIVQVVAIEGYPYLLTNGSASAAATAWAATDYSQALSGAEIGWSIEQRLHPWEPFSSAASAITIAVADASGTNADTFGLAVFKREGAASSQITQDVLPTSTSVVVRSSATFPAADYLYLGNETIKYTTNTAPGTFTGLTRGKWSPFLSSGGANFARTHRFSPTVPGLDPDIGTTSTVSTEPIEWRGRWVGVWLHRVVGGVLDTKAQAHLAFAGRIASVRDERDGRTVLHVDEVRQAISDAVIMREQWRSEIRPGFEIAAWTRFSLEGSRHVPGTFTPWEANDLVVVASGAAGANQIDAGWYTADELATKINAWLASEFAAGRAKFKLAFSASATFEGQPRSSLQMTDPVTTAGSRITVLTTTNPRAREVFGWGSDGLVIEVSPAYQATAFSDNPPRVAGISFSGGANVTVRYTKQVGSYVDQISFMRPAWAIGANTGIVRIRGLMFVCETPTGTADAGEIILSPIPINTFLGGETPQDWSEQIATDGAPIVIEQVLVLEGILQTLMLAMLASTGGGGNWPLYDVLPEQCSAAIPYDLMTGGLESEIAACPQANDRMTIIVDKATRFVDLFNTDMILRHVQMVWRQGRLALRGFATPTSAATLTITADDRGTGANTSDPLICVAEEDEEFLRNVIKIKHNADVTGANYRDTVTVIDPGSASNYGARPATIEARNVILGLGAAGEDLEQLLPTFIAGLPFMSRPLMRVRVPTDHNLFETATAGEVCLLSDGFARDPSTGRRGLTAKPGLIVANQYSWGGPGEPPSGSVDVVLFPRLSLAEYSPCAEVDETAAGAGYNAGTKVLTCYAHEHSESTATIRDAERFLVGHAVVVVEVDPTTAASPLSWSDVVASQAANTIGLTTGLAGYDTTKRYRVISANYATAGAAQRAKTYQADDADGLVANLRAPYGMIYSATGQVPTFTSASATEIPAKPPTLAAGDGAPLDTGHARDLARGVNNLIAYKTASQCPEIMEESVFSGSGTRRLVHCEPVFIGIGTTGVPQTRKLYVAPMLCSATGAAIEVRVTLAPTLPRSLDPSNRSVMDIDRPLPYTSATFTTSSTTYATATPVGLDTSHLTLTRTNGWIGGGIGWLYVEIGANAKFRGLGVKYVGPVEVA